MCYEEIKIGALYPLTGDYAFVGNSIKKALDFYVYLVNNQNEICIPKDLNIPKLGCRNIRLIWSDTRGDSEVALAEAKRLIEREGVTSIIGSYQSTVTSSVSLLTEVLKVPYVSADADAGVLARRGLKYFFKVGTDDITYTNALFGMMQANGILNYSLGSLAENSVLGQGDVQSLINVSNKYGYDISILELYSSEIRDIKERLIQMQCYNPGIIFTGQLSKDAITTIKALKELNYYPKAMFDQTSDYASNEVLEATGADANYIVSAVPWAVGVTKKIPLAKVVNEMFKDLYSENLNSVNSESFTGIYVLIDAITRAYSNTPEAIRKALVTTCIPKERLIMPWNGVCFNENGKNIFASSIVVQILNESLKIVWPGYFKEANLVFPAPQWNSR